MRFFTAYVLGLLLGLGLFYLPAPAWAQDADVHTVESLEFWRLFGLGEAVALIVVLTILVWVLLRERKTLKGMARSLESEVAERRSAQQKLELFRLAVEQSPASIVITSPDGVIEYVNREFCESSGYKAEDVLGQNPRVFKAGGLPDEHYAAMWREISAGRTWSGEFVNRRKSGEVFWESASICPVMDAQGALHHFIAVKKDITQRKNMEEELSRRSDVLQATLDNMLHGIVMVDKEGMVLAHNKRLQALFGFPEDFFSVPRHFKEIIHFWCEKLHLDQEYVQRFLQYAGKGVGHSFELELPEGRAVEVLHNPLPDGGFVRTATDITARKQAEALREDMERMARHDLKTPLNGVIGLPQLLLLDDNLTPEQRETLEQIREVGYRMLRSINLSLDLFKMETGRYELSPQPVNLLSLLREAMRDAGLPDQRRRISACLLCEGREPQPGETCNAWGEDLLCYNLFANLLTNAAQAAPAGSQVRIETKRQDDHVEVSIHNQGAVPRAVREHFFEKYATHGKVGGTGLGTYSARLFARVQQGEATMHSSEEEGTTLTVRLPAVREQQDVS